MSKINYQYGVEYETNGERPNLPDDVLIHWENKLGESGGCKAGELAWELGKAFSEVVKFRILDDRFKPSQLSQAGKLDIERIDVIGQNGNDGLHYGVKHDSDKPRYDLIPPHSLDEFAKVLTFGAKKYKPNGWRDVERERYVAALGRHWQALLAGETHDQESGLHHGAHLMCCAEFIAEMDIEAGMEL